VSLSGRKNGKCQLTFPKKEISLRFHSTRNLVTSKRADDLRLSISNSLFNKATGLAIVCPITNTNRHIPFHLLVPSATSSTGFVMTEQVKSVDYNARKAKFVEKAPSQFIEDVVAVVDACIQ
jgi:mRNA interferase MazF